MIKRIEDMPSGTIGFEAVGRVSSEDYDTVLAPAVSDAMQAGDVRLLYVLGDDFEAYSGGAMWADTKLWAGHVRGWHKIAVVTSHRWVHDAMKAFGWMMPGELRVYEPGQLSEAKTWVAE